MKAIVKDDELKNSQELAAERRLNILRAKLENPKVSLETLATQFHTSKLTVQKILRKYLNKSLGGADEIVHNDDLALSYGTQLAHEYLAEALRDYYLGKPKRVDLSKLAALLGDITKRRQLLTNGPTENVAQVITYLPKKESEGPQANLDLAPTHQK